MQNISPDMDELLVSLKALKSAKKYDEMLVAAQNAVRLFPEEKKLWDFLHFAQAHYVKSKLESQIVEQLEAKRDYVTLAAIYQKLLAVFPESEDLQGLLKKVRQKIQEAEQNQRKIFYKNAEKTIQDLFDKGELEEASQACYELLSTDKENKNLIRLLVKIQNKLDRQIDKDLDIYFKAAIPGLQAEFKADKKAFIRI